LKEGVPSRRVVPFLEEGFTAVTDARSLCLEHEDKTEDTGVYIEKRLLKMSEEDGEVYQ